VGLIECVCGRGGGGGWLFNAPGVCRFIEGGTACRVLVAARWMVTGMAGTGVSGVASLTWEGGSVTNGHLHR
jgi:hypothetical protein